MDMRGTGTIRGAAVAKTGGVRTSDMFTMDALAMGAHEGNGRGTLPCRRYDVVLFDLYGTLVDVRTDEESDDAWSTLRMALLSHGVTYGDNAALRAAFDRHMETITAGAVAEHGQWADPDVLPAFCELLGERDHMWLCRMLEAQELAWTFRKACTSRLALYPGARELLRALRRTGRRVVLVSNAQSCYTRPELEELELLGAFDRVVISSEEGVRKPSPELYERTLAAEGFDPEHAVMVGNDERSDILGARAAGIDGIYLRTAISPPNDPDASEYAVRSFAGADYAGVMETICEADER